MPSNMLHRVYLGLGSNLGERHSLLSSAIEALGACLGRIVRQSKMIETEPWGFVSSFCFVNAVVEVETTLLPLEILDITQEIERKLGRKHKSHQGIYHDRPIDIDILLYDDAVVQEERLIIPHPLLHQRLFVLESLDELIPSNIHPTLGQTFHQLFENLKEKKP